mmetsp:Transcript_38411/g.89629  ORF Transcript_38411/g.89629 Transcript_38411/m.89629 type:complete len:371 (-) Transcript_38411:684-1796(-)
MATAPISRSGHAPSLGCLGSARGRGPVGRLLGGHVLDAKVLANVSVEEVDGRSQLSNRSELVGAAHEAPVEGLGREPKHGVHVHVDVGARRRLGVADIVNEEDAHDGVGEVRVEDLDRLPEVGPAISGSKHLVGEHRGGGGGGGNREGDGGATLTSEDRPPLLDALGEGVVGALGSHEGVGEVHLGAVLGNGGLGLHGHHLAKALEHLEALLPGRRVGDVLLDCVVDRVVDDVGVGGGGEEVKVCLVPAVGLGEVLHDDIACKVDTHVQLAVQVRVAPNRHGVALGDLGDRVADPVADLGRVADHVAAALAVQVIARLTSEGLRHGESDGRVGVVVHLLDKTLPDVGAVNVDGDDVGAQVLENVEGAHGR